MKKTPTATIYKNNQRLDSGKNFGLINSSNFKTLYHDSLNLVIQWCLPVLPKKNFKIADYGGGNGIVSKKIINALIGKKFTDFVVENIDHDKNKFVKYKNFINVYHDILDYRAINRYDFSICRFLLHYFGTRKKKQLLKTIYKNTKPGGYLLLVNFVVDNKKNYTIKNKIFNFLETNKGIGKRYVPEINEIKKIITDTGFKIIKEKKISQNISVADFYKNRFKLTTQEITKITKIIGVNKHREPLIFILAKKHL